MMPKQKEVRITQGAIDSFLSSLSDNGYGVNTVRAYRSDLTLFTAAVLRSSTESRNPNLPVSPFQLLNLSPAEFAKSAAQWIGESRNLVSAKTLGRRLVSLRGLAKSMDLPPLLPNYRLPKPLPLEPHPLPGGIKDVYRMLEASDTDERTALVALCGLCGLRVAEASGRETLPSGPVGYDDQGLWQGVQVAVSTTVSGSLAVRGLCGH